MVSCAWRKPMRNNALKQNRCLERNTVNQIKSRKYCVVVVNIKKGQQHNVAYILVYNIT